MWPLLPHFHPLDPNCSRYSVPRSCDHCDGFSAATHLPRFLPVNLPGSCRSCSHFLLARFGSVTALAAVAFESRRLTFGAMNLSLADVLRAEAAAKRQDPFAPTRHKAVINIFLGGGPPHQDMWDIKTGAAAGRFAASSNPLPPASPAFRLAKRLRASRKPRISSRSYVRWSGRRGGHDAYQCTTGWTQQSLASMGGASQHRQCGVEAARQRRCERSVVHRACGENPTHAVE